MAERQLNVITAVGAILFLLVALHLVAIPDHQTLVLQQAMDFAHFPVFALVAVGCFVLTSARWSVTRRALVAFVIAITLGALSEAAQFPTPRDASIDDLITNCLGAFTGLLAAIAFHPGTLASRRAALVVLAIAVSTIALWPLISISHAYLKRAERFPVILSFEDEAETVFVRSATPVRIEMLGGRRYCGLLHAADDTPFKLEIVETEPGWTGYTTVNLRLRYDGDDAVATMLRINYRQQDHGDQPHEDRFNRALVISPGWNHIAIRLTDVFAAPRDRSMDASRISRVVVFTNRPSGPVCIDEIWLD